MPSIIIGGEEIRWEEQVGQEIGVSYNDPSSRREWQFRGSRNRDKILQAAGGVVPAIDVCAGVPRFFERYDLRETATQVWTLKSAWRKNPTYWELSIDTSGGTGKILQSFATPRAYECSGADRIFGSDPRQWVDTGLVPDFMRAIGVNGNNIDGCDQVIPKFDFSINYKLKMSTLSALYLMTLYDLTGRINDRVYSLNWKGQQLSFHPGDLRFMGAPCKLTSDDDLDITYRFSASKRIEVFSANFLWFVTTGYAEGELVGAIDASGYETVYRCLVGHTALPNTKPPNSEFWETANLTIGNSLPISKRGWEYLWVSYSEEQDLQTNRMVRVPTAAYVEQVCRYGNLGLLGIA